MIVKCTRCRLRSDEVKGVFGSSRGVQQDYHVTQGREYVVYGLSFAVGSNVHGTGVWVHIVSDHDHLTWAPIVLFEIVDPRSSRYWEARMQKSVFALWPRVFYRPHFHEELADGDVAAALEFSETRKMIEDESEA